MSLKSRKRREAKRRLSGKAYPRPSKPLLGPVYPPCSRCKISMAEEGTMATFWYGVAKRRREITARVCTACVKEIRTAGPGGSLKMHGHAQHFRINYQQPWIKIQQSDVQVINGFMTARDIRKHISLKQD